MASRLLPLLALAATPMHPGVAVVPPAAASPAAIELVECPRFGIEGARCGSYEVLENRDRPDGRKLSLEIVVLPATGRAHGDAVFYLQGGPGAPASLSVGAYADHPARADHDFVFVDVRGTAGDDVLSCDPEAGDDVRDRLAIFARTDVFVACRDRLRRTADLGEYSTPRMVDDVEAVRMALGYGPIDLIGTSGGTRTALVYMRRYPTSVRAVVLNGVTPLAFRNPLYHARSAQDALDGLIDLCASRPRCAAAYPNLREELRRVAARLAEPVQVAVEHPRTHETIHIPFDRTLLGESLRQLMYRSPGGARVPYLIHRAAQGDFDTLANMAVARAIGLSIPIGTLNSVICTEDAARIRDDEIADETAGTLLGDARVRQQLAVCAIWPRTHLDRGYAEPVSTEHPTLILSGTLDPVTPPRWGAEAASHLPNSRQIVVPGGHGVGGECLAGIVARFLDAGTTRGLDIGCSEHIRYPDFALP